MGFTGTQATYVLPYFLPRFKERYPPIEILLVEAASVLGKLGLQEEFTAIFASLGGGPDVAAGADISIVCLPVIRGRTPSVTRRVFTCCTPGETVAVVVTEAGIALNPKHRYYRELKEDLERANLKTVTIEYLQQLAESLTGVPREIETGDVIACIVEYRDGTVIDVIRTIRKE